MSEFLFGVLVGAVSVLIVGAVVIGIALRDRDEDN